MKYLQKVLLATTLLVTTLGFGAFSANADVIKQDVSITIFDVADGNAWGIDSSLIGETVDFGTIKYGINNVADGGIVSAPDFFLGTGDDFFKFDFALEGFMLSIFDAIDYGFGLPLAFTADPGDAASGLALFAEGDFLTADGGEGFIIDNFVDFIDAAGAGFIGELSFGDAVFVSEPSVLAIFLAGLALVMRRKIAAK